MNNIFQEKRNTFLLLVGLFFVLLIVLYFAFLSPLSEELKGKESSLVTLKSDIQSMEKEVDLLDNMTESFDMERVLQEKRMPVTRELEQLVLTLQEIELVSSSIIETIDFHYDSSLPTTEFLRKPDEDGDQSNTGSDSEETETGPAIDLSTKPEKLQIITVRMDVLSPDYEHFQEFITEIEKQERIMVVSRLKFDKPAEKALILEEEPDETIVYNLELVTFYYAE